VVPVDICGY